MCRFLPGLLLFCSVVNGIDSTGTRQFYMGEDCGSYATHDVSEHDVYEIIWKDQTVPYLDCEIELKGRDPDGDILDKYKICVNATEFVIKDCNVKVNYRLNVALAKSFSCNDYPPAMCSGSGEYFSVELKDDKSSTSGNFYPGSKFKLVVTAVKTYAYTEINTHPYIFAIVMGVWIPLVSVIGVVIFLCIEKRNRSRDGHSGQSGHTNTAIISVADTYSHDLSR